MLWFLQIMNNLKVLVLYIDLKTCEDFAITLYKEQNVMLLPGSLFLSKSFFRIVLCADNNVKNFYKDYLKLMLKVNKFL